jgi:hypothetical protein
MFDLYKSLTIPGWIVVISIVLSNLVIIGGIVYFLLRLRKSNKSTLKKCPLFAEQIQPEAIVCRFCSKDI